MDAKVGDWVVTPRIGKPVEVQALWLNALKIAGDWNARWLPLFEQGVRAFQTRFWNASQSCLYDVIDVDHQSGRVDPTVRPNQIFAVGGLPEMVLEMPQARAVVRKVDETLWTPVGLRSLAPDNPAYRGHYQGGVRERDGCYHQGTVWPWLTGPFMEALLRVGEDPKNVRARLVEALPDGQLPEIRDGDSPHASRGCPFQAWSVAERLRIGKLLEANGSNEFAYPSSRSVQAQPSLSH
jgi:glycogen debranching enzyme